VLFEESQRPGPLGGGSCCAGPIIGEVRAVSRFAGNTVYLPGVDGACTPSPVEDLFWTPYVVGETLNPQTLFPEMKREQRN